MAENTVVTIQNSCPMAVFPQIYTPSSINEMVVHPTETIAVTLLGISSIIRIIPRTGCKPDGSGGFHQCLTGNCGGTSCESLEQLSDATVIEIIRSSSTGAFTSRVSYEHGANIPNVDVLPFCSGNDGCDQISCKVDLEGCPSDDRVIDDSGVFSACIKPDNPNQPWLKLSSSVVDEGYCSLPYGSYYSSRATAATCTDCKAFKVILD